MAEPTQQECWRLLKSPPLNGVENMALDQQLLQQAAGEGSVTLRLYRWEPACISIGYAQSVTDIDREQIKQSGWDWVRRPTGGRAILHTDELTYSISGPIDHPLFQGSILESYRRISAGIASALAHLGLQVEIQSAEPAQTREVENPICFEVPAAYEITFDRRKLIGSAQHRSRDGVLQHGTLPLTGDLGRIVEGLSYDSPANREQARKRIRERAITVEAALGHPVSWNQAAEAFVRGFGSEFGVGLLPFRAPAAWEQALQEIKQDRYSNSAWLGRV